MDSKNTEDMVNEPKCRTVPAYNYGQRGQPRDRPGYPYNAPPGYVSTEASRWRGPIGRSRYESDINKYGIVEADRKAQRRRRVVVVAAAAG